jgi:hypothetical protein
VLFQRRYGHEHRPISASVIREILAAALDHTGLTDQVTGDPLRFTPHDFRLFITDAVLNGLPPHIAQVIAGHRDIRVTLSYKAVYRTRRSNRIWRSSPDGGGAAAHRRMPGSDRRGMGPVPRPLRTPQGLDRHLWARVRLGVYPRTRTVSVAHCYGRIPPNAPA